MGAVWLPALLNPMSMISPMIELMGPITGVTPFGSFSPAN